MHSRRAILYVPGDDQHKIRKATGLGVDCICMDMEDGVASNRKEQARQSIVKALGTYNFGQSERLARINAIGSGLESDDLRIVLPARPDGIVVPKVEEGEQVRWVSEKITAAEREMSWPVGSIPLIILVETARGVVNLAKIAGAAPRLEAIIFGAEDLAGDVGMARTRAGSEVIYARSAIVVHAAAFNLQAIDMVFIDFKDEAGLREEAMQGVQMGFAGKQIIHPDQVAPVQEVFTPSEEAIARALTVMEEYANHQSDGLGAFAMDGKMVDAPAVKAAERVLARARAAGKIK
jgi:citrate lyase beta subunit